jgi:cyclic pyranopterin phosphate synthase
MYEFSEFKAIHYIDRLQAICRGELPPPVTVEVDLTNACNHRCIWCMDQSYNIRINATLKEIPLLDFAADIASQGVQSVVFKGGGEPLLYYSFSKVAQHFRSKGLHLGLITNGEAINRHIDAIPHLSWVQVSLDAATAETHQKLHNPFKTNVFQTIVDNLYQISTSVFTGVIYIIHPDNFQELTAAARLARDVGCRSITFKRVIGEESRRFTPPMVEKVRELVASTQCESLGPGGRESANFQVLAPRLHYFDQGYKYSPYPLCLAHHLIGILGSDGNLYPCRTLRGESDYTYGSIYRETFQDIWYGERRKSVLKKISRKECADKCLGCTSYLRYDHYNQWLEYLSHLSQGKDKVEHGEFL